LELDCCGDVIRFLGKRAEAAYTKFMDEEDGWEGRVSVIRIQTDSLSVILCLAGVASIVDKHEFSFLKRTISDVQR
jgi:hypothetical protein